MTLAALESLGHYTAVYAVAGNTTYGKGAGCGFINAKCNTAAGGRDTFFCFDSNRENNHCSRDLLKVSYCDVKTYTADLPAAFQYFSDARLGGPRFMDGCPFLRPFTNRYCNEVRTSNTYEALVGHKFTATSRCFTVGNLIATGHSSPTPQPKRCLEARCPDGLVEFRVGNARVWTTCRRDGAVMTGFTGFDGSVTCPVAADMCASLSKAASGSSNSTQTHAAGGFTLTGSGWAPVLADTNTSIKLEAALRSDTAELLGLTTSQVHIDGMRVGSLIVSFWLSTPAVTAEKISVELEQSPQTFPARTKALYASSGASDTTALVRQTSTATTEGMCGSINIDDGACAVLIAGVCLFVLFVIIFIVAKCCCKRSKKNRVVESPKDVWRGSTVHAAH
jgi:hypothetical protein